MLRRIRTIALVAAALPSLAHPASAAALDRVAPDTVVQLPGGARAAAASVAGDGFLRYDTGLLPSGYTIRLVDSPGIEQFRSEFEAAAAELVSITGLPFTVAPGLIAGRSATTGEILVRVSPDCDVRNNTDIPLGCAVPTRGYGGPRADVEYELSAQVYVMPHAIVWGYWYHVARHELGHALGLQHYRGLFEGKFQMMNDQDKSARTYMSGDRNGLVYGRDRGAV